MRDAVVVRHAPIAQDFDESAVLDGALDWLGVHLVWFEPDTWDAYFPPRAFPGTTILELLLLCRSLRRGPQAAHHDEFVEAALDIADRVVHHEEFRTDLSQVDIQFPYRLWLLGLMHRLGRSPREPLAAAQKLVDALDGDPGSDIGSARGRLEVGYALELCELRHAMPERAELYGACGVADLDPASVTEEDAYEFTHILFHATDMAARSLPFRDAAERDKLAAAVHSMLAGFLAAEHFDLTAELLLCAEIVGISDAGVAARAGADLRQADSRQRRPQPLPHIPSGLPPLRCRTHPLPVSPGAGAVSPPPTGTRTGTTPRNNRPNTAIAAQSRSQVRSGAVAADPLRGNGPRLAKARQPRTAALARHPNLSAWAAVDNRWVTRTVVRPGESRSYAASTAASVAWSSAAVGSSSSRMSGRTRAARASAMSWRCPVDTRWPRSPTWNRNPPGSAATTSSAPTSRTAAVTSASLAPGRP